MGWGGMRGEGWVRSGVLGEGGAATIALASSAFYMTNTSTGINNVSSNTGSPTLFSISDVKGDIDPDIWNIYEGALVRNRLTAGVRQGRGHFQHLAGWPIGTQVDLDRMLVDESTTVGAYKFFASLTLGTGFGLGIGGDAT